MASLDSTCEQVEQDIWAWIQDFVTAPNDFYDGKFAPCPFARQALAAGTVDVRAWYSGDARTFLRAGALEMRDRPDLTTRVMAFPPQTRFLWGINDFVEELNAELIATNVFLNTGTARTTASKYPGSQETEPYFIVIANSLDAVLAGARSLAKTNYYEKWPAAHYAHVVERRARMAQRYGKQQIDF